MSSEPEIPLQLQRLLVEFSSDLLISVKNLANHEEIPKAWRNEIKKHFSEINRRLRVFKGWDDKEPRSEVETGMRLIRDNYERLEFISSGQPSKNKAELIKFIAAQVPTTTRTIRTYIFAYECYKKGEPVEPEYANALTKLQEEEEFNDVFDDSELED